MTRRLSIAAGGMRIVCAAMMLLLGLAHQQVGAAASTDANGETYRLPDGTFADICSTSGSHHMPASLPRCELCTLATSCTMPSPADQAESRPPAIWLANPLRQIFELPGIRATVLPQSRAPPSAV